MGTIQLNIPKQVAMKLLFLTLCSLLSLGFSQDTYHCPDGWLLEEDRSGCRCFYFSESEMVTRDDADVLCAAHNGAWVAELDHPGINYWLKSQLLEVNGIGLTGMKQFSGLTGLTENLTTCKENIVWF